MYEQQEYGLAWGLVLLFLILGMLVVCIPRPRRVSLQPVDKVALAKEKAAAKRKKKSQKAKKKKKKKKK